MKKIPRWAKVMAVPALYLLNTIATPILPLGETSDLNENFSLKGIPKRLDLHSNPKHCEVISKLYSEKEQIAFAVLRYSHLHVISKLDYQKNDVLNLEQALDSGFGDCKDTSLLTYMCYLDFAKKHNPEIMSEVRLAGGIYKDNSIAGRFVGESHMWLEYRKDDLWKPYDTTMSINDTNDVDVANITKVDGHKVNSDRYYKIKNLQVNSKGELDLDVNWINCLKYWPGFFGQSVLGITKYFSD